MWLKTKISKRLTAKMRVMKTLRDKIEHYVLKVEEYWNVLPAERQRLLTKILLAGYALLTVSIIVSVFIPTGQRSHTLFIDHINGIAEQSAKEYSKQNDTVSSTPKK